MILRPFMTIKLACSDYGFECDYEIEGAVEKVIFDYWEHMNNEHGIEYSKESILESIKRKNTIIQKSIEKTIEV